MRAEYDKKNKKTSITMTEEDFVVIERNARLKGMRVSPYMVDCALHHDETLTPRDKSQNADHYELRYCLCKAV